MFCTVITPTERQVDMFGAGNGIPINISLVQLLPCTQNAIVGVIGRSNDLAALPHLG